MASERDQDGVAAMIAPARLLLRLLLVGVPLIFLVGCVAEGPGYYGYAPGYDLGYYGGYGLDYGVWGSSYGVGPFFGARRFDHNRGGYAYGGRPGTHGFRPAPGSRAIPSIPSAPRGGGHAPGGGRGGGGGHGGGHGGGGGRSR
jgi:hypothetical protein